MSGRGNSGRAGGGTSSGPSSRGAGGSSSGSSNFGDTIGCRQPGSGCGRGRRRGWRGPRGRGWRSWSRGRGRV